ncbi:DMT family transporter [Methylopila turkensis]|uniref:Guanidinium exporter n=1 Tax=Methylopila turkensis TaxID=1437816 RepID=A0A9W6N5M2_9HYPH|nr:multidrug efflux SMR transporter [Methylopila turkensis]GLK78387.1 multidrug SMR transporter [Methylopila turkensis]
MGWVYLLAAGLMEIVWATGLKYSEGFTKLVPTVVTVISIACSLTLLGLALRTLPIGIGYAAWTGIGVVGTTIFGMAVFGEPATAARIGCIGLILAGVVGLKIAG